MNPIRRLFAPLLGLVLALSATVTQVQANTPQSLNQEALAKMQAGKWQEALQALKTATDKFDKQALQFWGPQFGVTWYRKGICEQKLEQWGAAAKSFETCYKDYANKSDDPNATKNAFEKRALLRWAEVEKSSGDHEKAIELFKKFLSERNPQRDKFHPGALFINLSICYLELGKLSEGVEHLETALKNKENYQTPDSAIMGAFTALVNASIDKSDEKALVGFINNNRATLMLEPYEMVPYSTGFLIQAGKAYNGGLQKSALLLYQLVPSTQVMIEDIESRIASLDEMGNLPDGSRRVARSELEASLKKLNERLDSGDPNEVTLLAATAFVHEMNGNQRGAFTAYEQLEQLYPKSKNRETQLYNLVRVASSSGKLVEAQTYGLRFLDDYPNSERRGLVSRLMLVSLFQDGEYDKCIELGEATIGQFEEGSEEHDMCLHVLGGSYYFTNENAVAKEKLDQHVEAYPESQFRQTSLYFQASNEARLGAYGNAAKLLDAFIEAYPDPRENGYLAYALLDRARCHYELEEYGDALQKLTRIQTEFPGSQILPSALNLKGNSQENLNKLEDAVASYQKALKAAEEQSNYYVADESLYYLISFYSKENSDNAEGAIPYIDEFWEKYSDSPYAVQVAIVQAPALEAAGRGDEILEFLRKIIVRIAAQPGAPFIESSIVAYRDQYLKDHSPEDLKIHFYEFEGIGRDKKVARALLRISIIEVFEQELKSAGDDENKRIQIEATIKTLFKDLSRDFDLKDLSNLILVRVGDFIRQTSSAEEAVPYYDEVLGREKKAHRFAALFGRAAVMAQGDKDAKFKAIDDFKKVLAESEDKNDKDRALYQLAKTQLEVGQFEEAKNNIREYLTSNYTSKKPEMALMLGQAYEGMGSTGDALSAYTLAAGGNTGAIRISAPATKRAMEMFWELNGEDEKGLSHRQGAYNMGRRYIDNTRRIVVGDSAKATEEEVAMWKEVEVLVGQYEANPEVKSKEQLAEENR